MSRSLEAMVADGVNVMEISAMERADAALSAERRARFFETAVLTRRLEQEIRVNQSYLDRMQASARELEDSNRVVEELRRSLEEERDRSRRLERQASVLQRQNRSLKRRIGSLERRMADLLASTSWKITAPVRLLKDSLRRARR